MLERAAAFAARVSARHGALKRRVHAFRMPVKSRAGLFALGVVYFTVPVVAGWYLMGWTNAVAASNHARIEARRRA